jgi:peptidoglycan glycosyltransferase
VVDRILSPKGSIVVRAKPDELGRAVKQETAGTIASMMQEAVESGTGTAARISGLVVGGKTGTAETGVEGTNNAWFICFAGPEGERPQVAIAVVLEQQNGTGGVLAAPIAREVMQALLPEAANS